MDSFAVPFAQIWPFALALLLCLMLVLADIASRDQQRSWVQRLDHWVAGLPTDGALEWLHFGKFSSFSLVLLFLSSFGGLGYAIQWLSLHSLGSCLPFWMVFTPALLLALWLVRMFGLYLLTHPQPAAAALATTSAQLVGRLATISSGTARVGQPAQARVRDQQGHLHHVWVEPETGELSANTEVLLTHAQGSFYVGRLLDQPAQHTALSTRPDDASAT